MGREENLGLYIGRKFGTLGPQFGPPSLYKFGTLSPHKYGTLNL